MRTITITSRMSIHGHPIHPMLIHFPVAALLGLMGADLGYVVTGDDFWFRAGLWLSGIGTLGGWFSGLIGLLDLVTVAAIRRLVTAWCHAVMAVMLLSLATLNWLLRITDGEPGIVPWGIYLSFLSGAMIALTSLLGGQLVYDHAVGVGLEKTAERAEENRQIEDMES